MTPENQVCYSLNRYILSKIKIFVKRDMSSARTDHLPLYEKARMQKQRKAKPAKRSSFQGGHIQIGYAIDLSKGKHADELKVKKCTHAKASSMEKSPNEAPFWRERGTDACRWIVDTPMLEQRKTYGCNKYPFYKNFPHPPRTSYL